LAIGDSPLLLKQEKERTPRREEQNREGRQGPEARQRRGSRGGNDFEFETYRVEVGHEHGAKPGNIVGALANEAGIGSDAIGRVTIEQSYSTVQLPEGMPDELYRDLQKVWVCGQMLKISLLEDPQSTPVGDPGRPVQKRQRVNPHGADKDHKPSGQSKRKKNKGLKKDKKGKRKNAKP
jgi:ATP-dependent RNA helicase DeaD